MADNAVAIRFNNVTYRYSEKKVILDDASFSVRENSKITIMGQNGAGKSTIFKLITGALKPQEGTIHIKPGASIGIALQVIPRDCIEMTLTDFFGQAFADSHEKIYDLDRRIARVLETVNLDIPHDRIVGKLSGGQQARLLLAYALIQKPDILLLDEPTNNLDEDGINHLIMFLLEYEKTVIVISHDASFLNTFTDGVLHLDAYIHKTQQFVGDYFTVVEEITAQVEKEQRKNAQLKKTITDRKEKVNFFANKGGKMRKLASKLKEEIAESEDQIVNVRQEDKTIRPFIIPVQEVKNPILHLNSVGIVINHKRIEKNVDITLRKGDMLRITGPNGIGKTTLLEALAHGTEKGMEIVEGVREGYYRQDFSGLDFDSTAFKELRAAQVIEGGEEAVYRAAAHFLLTGDALHTPIGSLSEGQKGLLSYAKFLLQKPGLLILDEPTNHINFRHLPIIAEALNKFEGAIVVVCHDQEFVDQLKISQTLDLNSLKK